MAKQTIDIGSSANDGTGDPLRTAFDKCNDNFDELYAQGITTYHVMQDGSGLSNNLVIKNASSDTAGRVHIEPTGYPATTKSKLDLMGDPFDEQDGGNLAYRVLTSYFTEDAADEKVNGRAIIAAKSSGQNWGVWPTLELGFNDGADGAICLRMFYFDTNLSAWVTPLKGAWRTGVAYSAGDYVLANNNLYQADGSGTSGVTRPSHEVGSVSDGGVDWTFVDAIDAGGAFKTRAIVTDDINALPRSGFAEAGIELQRDLLVRTGSALAFESNVGGATWEIISQPFTDEMRIVNIGGAGGYLRFDGGSNFIQWNNLTELHGPKTIANAGATPSLANTKYAIITQSGPTNITAFSGNLGRAQCFVEFGDGNSTLIHSANLDLRGGANVTPSAGDVYLFIGAGSGSSSWKQIK